MPHFKNINEIGKYKEWNDVESFRSKNRLVDDKGVEISKNYEGHCYQIISKKSHAISSLKLIARRILGGLAVFLSCSLAYKNKSIKKLLFKTTESVRFAEFVQVRPQVVVKVGEPLTQLSELSEEVINLVKSGATHKEVCELLNSKKFEKAFKCKNHELAKDLFEDVMEKALGSEVTFVRPLSLENGAKEFLPAVDGALDEEKLNNFKFELPGKVKQMFGWEETKGVQHDILRASHDADTVHLFSVASQYNCAEASSDVTPPLGQAIEKSKNDFTQGPLAQGTNPIAFELVTAFLTHLGFNMMEKVLPESVGKTYPTKEVPARKEGKTAILNGYLQPAGWFYNADEAKQQAAKQNIKEIVDHMESHIGAFETVCYSNKPKDGGDHPVHLILAAAPNMSAPFYGPEKYRLEYLAARAHLTTQLQQALELANKEPQKDVVLHATLPGLGVFGNYPISFAKAAGDSVMEFYEQLTEEQRNRIKVKLSVYVGDGQGEAYLKAKQVTDGLGLQKI